MSGCEALALHWLAPAGDFAERLSELTKAPGEPAATFAQLQDLANRRLDFLQTRKLDRALTQLAAKLPERTPRLRLALVGSSTLDHLVPGIRIGALRRGLLVDVTVGMYGQWRQQIMDAASDLYAAKPDVVLIAVDALSLLPELPLGTPEDEVADIIEETATDLANLWAMLRDRAKAVVVQQTLWSDEPPLFGHFERLLPAAPFAMAHRLDAVLAERARASNTILFDLRQAAMSVGARHIGDVSLWHHAKQSIAPAAVPWAGDHVGRILAAIRGLSKKVLVLDLDNTLWGGVIGDDGVEGIVLGQGNASGEAFIAFQRYAKRLAERGIVLAVSSKNDRAVAEAAFANHPEMVLKLSDFAAFEADWNDKPSALKRIAEQLELGLDSFVFVDDNPAERDLMRRTLPQVAVPELPVAPEHYARCVADAGYFEAIAFTPEDTQRNAQYVANKERRRMQSSATDMGSFLRDLQMVMTVSPFTPTDIARITQLINKTNQFNLTTRRYTEAEVRAMMEDPRIVTLTARLADKFGDNGLISILIGRPAERDGTKAIEIDTWLMSCRVLGRRVEETTLRIMAEESRARGAEALLGRYVPTSKNGMVKDHYAKLGFEPLANGHNSGETLWRLALDESKLPTIDHIELVRHGTETR
jgi:FkbH-like protein